jgi:hypothetical protein
LGATDSRERAIADSQFGGGATTWAPSSWFLGASITTPATDGSGFTEPTGGAYARITITNNATNFPAATTTAGTTTKTNGTAFVFANPTGTWGLLTYFGFFTALTGGTPEYWFKLDANITVQNGNTPVQFDIGQLIMTFGA